jgi:antitoxin component of MazEF toxin-antitoxin module
MKLQNNKGQFRLTLPKDLIKIKGWKQGTEVAVFMDTEGNLIIKEIKKKKK